MNLRILDVAEYLPEKKIANSFFQKVLNTSDGWIRSRTGIVGRHVAEHLTTSDMAIEAAKALTITPGNKEKILASNHANSKGIGRSIGLPLRLLNNPMGREYLTMEKHGKDKEELEH